jgi:cell wall assembly regulator SMI1
VWYDVAVAAPVLTVPLLEELKRRWQRQRAPLLARLRPGLSSDAMDALTEPLGLHVPSEARTWWGWHDGAVSDGRSDSQVMGGQNYRFISLHEAVTECLENRQGAKVAVAGTALEAEVMWSRRWLPIVGTNAHGGLLVVDGTDPNAHATPVYYSEPAEPAAPDDMPDTPTLGQVVQWWIEAMDDGAFVYDAEAGCWNHNYERLDPQRELTRIV